MSIKQRITLKSMPKQWLNEMATVHHYMHRPIHAKACPFGWAILWDGDMFHPDETPYGFIIFSSVHFTKLKDEFGYEGLPTKWQVLLLSRLWLHDELPRNSETCVIAKSLKKVQHRWLQVHPPVNPDEPYHIRKIISYADTRYHEGTIYKAANFRFSGRTQSQKRHKNSRGPGMGEADLLRFVYDLKKPNWHWEG